MIRGARIEGAVCPRQGQNPHPSRLRAVQPFQPENAARMGHPPERIELNALLFIPINMVIWEREDDA